MTISHPDGVTLNDYADDALAPAVRSDVAAHVASCAECRALVDSLHEVRAAARRLPPLRPRSDAWQRIERAIRANNAGPRSSRWSWFAAAAALVLATGIGFGLASLRQQPAAGPIQTSSDASTAQSVEAELMQAEEHYQKAIAGLEKIADAEKGALDPQTASTLEKNLTVIDQAISERRAALRSEPSSEPAQPSLLESFKSKISLLQETVALINQMRQAPGLKQTQKGT
jgi:anti-sigma factor RsiW